MATTRRREASSRTSARTSERSRGLGGEQVEGRRAVRELLRARRRGVHEVWLSNSRDAPRGLRAPGGSGAASSSWRELEEIEGLAAVAGAAVRWVPRSRLDAHARTASPQGVLAFAAEIVPTDLAKLCGGASQAHSAAAGPVGRGSAPFLLVLDGVADPGNLGSLLRSAASAGVTGVVLPRHRAAHITPAAAKAAAGAVEHLEISLVAGIPAALGEMGKRGLWRIGLDPLGDSLFFGLGLEPGPVALVLGSEGRGLSRLARARCDTLAAIPQVGPIKSLNVAVAGALACYEIMRTRARL